MKSGTPQAVIDQLYREVKSSVEEPAFVARLQSLAYEPVLMPPAKAAAFLSAAAAFIDLVRSQGDEFVMQLLAYVRCPAISWPARRLSRWLNPLLLKSATDAMR